MKIRRMKYEWVLFVLGIITTIIGVFKNDIIIVVLGLKLYIIFFIIILIWYSDITTEALYFIIDERSKNELRRTKTTDRKKKS